MATRSTRGIEAVWLETHNWGRTARFFQMLGYELEFETGHRSGQFRNGEGPYVFVAEVPEDQPTATRLVFGVDDAGALDLASGIEVVSPFEPTHWDTQEMTVRDPDGRLWSLQAPAPAAPS